MSDDTGFGGDGGVGATAKLAHPVGPEFDLFGDVIFVDYGNQRVRLISKIDGRVTTLAGGGDPSTPLPLVTTNTEAVFTGLSALAVDPFGAIAALQRGALSDDLA